MLADGDTAENAASGVVRDVVYLGDAIKYAMQLDGGGEMVVRWPFRRDLRPHDVGESLRVGWPGDLLHVVDWS